MLILVIKYSYRIAKQSAACLTFELGLRCELGAGMYSLPSVVVKHACINEDKYDRSNSRVQTYSHGVKDEH